MIRKSLTTAVVLLVLFEGWLRCAHPIGNHTLRGLHNMIFIDGNIIRAQQYLHGRHDQPIAFVGSSMTEILEPFLNQPDVACLGMPGMGPMDGLKVIQRSGARPQLVMIEGNLINRDISKDLFAEVFQPQLYWLNEHFMSSLHEFQPANLLVPRLDAAVRGEPLEPPRKLVAQPLPTWHRHNAGENRGRYDYLQSDVDGAIRNLAELHEMTRELNVPIQFYLLPEHPDVNHAPAMKQLQEVIEAEFQQKVLTFPKDEVCTSDGTHLAQEEASACAFTLLEYSRKRTGR